MFHYNNDLFIYHKDKNYIIKKHIFKIYKLEINIKIFYMIYYLILLQNYQKLIIKIMN